MTSEDRATQHQAWLAKEKLTERPISVSITETASGETRTYVDTGLWDEDGEFQDYIWDEGNFACDCNRFLFFSRAAGVEPDDDDPRHGCGDERYVVKITDVEGATVYEDDPPTEPQNSHST